MDAGIAERNRLVRDTNAKIAKIYAQAGKELAAKTAQAKDGSLTQRWHADMAKSCKDRVEQLGKELASAISDSTARAARIPAGATGDWLNAAFRDAGAQGLDKSFRGTLARTSDEALKQVVTGNAYLDGKSLSKRIWGVEGRLRGGINAALGQGIAQHKSARELAKDLEQYMTGEGCKYYAKRVAQTSINHAYHLAAREAAKANPFCKAMHWRLSASHKIWDVCDEYARNDEGLGLGNFALDAVPLPHAMCLCSQYQVLDKSLDECAKDLRDWMDGTPNAKLDEAFGAWKRENGLDNVEKPDTMRSNRRDVNLTAADGLQIKQYSSHALDQMRDRGVTEEELQDALINPLHICADVIDEKGRSSRRYIGASATVNVNPDEGVVATLWKTGTKVRERYERNVQR